MIDPAGMSILSPWLAMMITVPLKLTPFPKVTSPDTVRWSSSSRSGMEPNLDRKSDVILKYLLPSLTRGVDGNILFGDIISAPWFRVYRLDITSNKSLVFFTGRNLDRGTFKPSIIKTFHGSSNSCD